MDLNCEVRWCALVIGGDLFKKKSENKKVRLKFNADPRL